MGSGCRVGGADGGRARLLEVVRPQTWNLLLKTRRPPLLAPPPLNADQYPQTDRILGGEESALDLLARKGEEGEGGSGHCSRSHSCCALRTIAGAFPSCPTRYALKAIDTARQDVTGARGGRRAGSGQGGGCDHSAKERWSPQKSACW